MPPQSVSFSAGGILRGMRRLVPVSLFVIPFGVAFGIAGTEQGLSPLQATAMSAFVFTATGQFAALDFLGEPIAFVSLGFVTLALSGRHVIMGVALSRWVNRLPIGKRIATLAFLSDANFADSLPLFQRGNSDVGTLLGGGVMLWLTWIFGTALGAFGGDLIGDTDALGFGAVMLSFFAATVAGMLRVSPSLIVPVLVAMIVSVVALPLLPTGWNIILAAIVGGTSAVIFVAQ